MSEEKCGNCRFWDDHGDEEDATPRAGNCRRYPPVRNLLPDDDDTESHRLWSQPTTGGHWWCGEWQPVRVATPPTRENLKTPLSLPGDDQNTTRAKNCLKAAGIFYLEDAQAMTDKQLIDLPNVGRGTVSAIRAMRPAAVAVNPSEWPPA